MNVLHQITRFRRRRGALLGEVTDLVGDDTEAFAVLAGARRLDRGVQGEQIRHLGELPNGSDEPGDTAAHLAELLHLGGALPDERFERD